MSHQRRCPLILASTLLLTSFLLLAPSTGLALYLFFDTDGDGVRTKADVLSPEGMTHATVCLVTDEYREGTSDDCSHGRTEGDHEYYLVIQASGGSVAWGRYVSTPGQYEETFYYESDDSTYFMVSRNIPDWGLTHMVRLGSFTVSVRRGRPKLEFVSQCPIHPGHRTFISTGTWGGGVSTCSYELPYGGQANRRPSLTRLADYPIRAGTAERLTIVATDQDGDPLAFRLRRGPPFVSVRTLEPGHGAAEGEISVAPDSCTRGSAECVIEVSDGIEADADTMLYLVQPIVHPLAASPMQAPLPSVAPAVSQERGPIDSQWLLGEWEWHDSSKPQPRLGIVHEGPAQIGYRERLVFRRNGEVEMFEVGAGRVLRARRGTYDAVSNAEGAQLTISNWLGPYSSGRSDTASFVASKNGRSSFIIYQRRVADARSQTFVRVPTTQKEGAPTDTGTVIAPIDTPSVRLEQNGVKMTLPKPMQAALRRCDPTFRVWDGADSRELDPGLEVRGPSAIVGDFDGDLLQDAALLGQSGADQVVIAILSNHGNIEAQEVAWRRVRRGQRENMSRGDPKEIPPIYLELAPRGALNPFCWVRQWGATPVDAVGIVEPGVARFDYVLVQRQFALFAPIP